MWPHGVESRQDEFFCVSHHEITKCFHMCGTTHGTWEAMPSLKVFRGASKLMLCIVVRRSSLAAIGDCCVCPSSDVGLYLNGGEGWLISFWCSFKTNCQKYTKTGRHQLRFMCPHDGRLNRVRSLEDFELVRFQLRKAVNQQNSNSLLNSSTEKGSPSGRNKNAPLNVKASCNSIL